MRHPNDIEYLVVAHGAGPFSSTLLVIVRHFTVLSQQAMFATHQSLQEPPGEGVLYFVLFRICRDKNVIQSTTALYMHVLFREYT